MNNQELDKKINNLEIMVKSLEVRTQEDNEAAVQIDKVVAQREKEVHEAFDPTVEAAHKSWKTALAQRAIYLNPLKSFKSLLRKKVAQFFDEQKRIAKQQEEELKKNSKGISPEVHINIEKPKGQIVGESWKAIVVDIKKVPRKYLLPDQKKLDKMAKATKDKSDIPGVEFKCETTVHTRRS